MPSNPEPGGVNPWDLLAQQFKAHKHAKYTLPRGGKHDDPRKKNQQAEPNL
ncbi:MAG: hypothetical protein PHC78_07875 [Verrucomicrobiota bacterium]|nr:hypothetical protein [Verrucomicrobiota bacterium]